MNTDSLRAFVATAEHHSLTLAANELELSQPAISKQLKGLQQKLKVKLYERNGHGIKVTMAGEILFRHAKPILAELDHLPELIASAARTTAALPGRLRIAGSFMLSMIVLPKLLARFQKRQPSVELELVTGSQEQIEAHVLGDKAELGMSTQAPLSRKFDCAAFRRERLVFFVASSHRLAKQQRITKADLHAEPIIARGDLGNRDVASAVFCQLTQSGLAANVREHFNSPIAVKTAVGRRMGVGLLFEDTIEQEVKNGAFKILRGHGLKLEGMSYILSRKGRELPPLAREFLNLARKASSATGALPQLATAPHSDKPPKQ